MKRANLLLIAVLATACGHGEPYAPNEASAAEPVRDLGGYEARIAELQRELDSAVPEPSAVPAPPGPPEPDYAMDEPDYAPSSDQSDPCAVGRDLRDRICELAERICTIAQRDPSAADTQLKCLRARDACGDARSRVAGACAQK